ncbi:MAG: hypothetical protein ACKOXB_05675 [Flavobacteriales bacterium]
MILFIGSTLSACLKPRTDANDTDTSLAQNYSYVEQNNNEINNIIIEVIEKDTITSLKTSEAGDLLSNCVDFKKTISQDTITVVVDFGSNNCLCADQKYRRGKIIIKALSDKNWARAYTENFYVNDNLIEGNRTITRSSLLEVTVSGDTKVTFGDTAAISESFNRSILFSEGVLTNDPNDDVFSITGTTSGICKKGPYTTKILSPLKRKRNCTNIVSGVLEIALEKKAKRLIDFGNGECDNVVTLSIGNYSKIIALQ